MTAHLDTLRAEYEAAEQALYAKDAEYQAALQAVRDQYTAEMGPLGDAAYDAQKALCDAEAVWAARDRPEVIADLSLIDAIPGVEPGTAAAWAEEGIDAPEVRSRIADAVAAAEAEE